MGNNGLILPIPGSLAGSLASSIKPTTSSFAMPSHKLFYMNFNFEDIKVKKLFIDPDHIFYIQSTIPVYLGFWTACSKRLTREYIENNMSRISLGFIYADGETRGRYIFLSSGLFRDRRDLMETMERVYDDPSSENWCDIPWTILGSLFKKYGQGKYGK